MPKVAIICGVLLILVGLGGFGYAVATLAPGVSAGRVVTALIPAVFGLILAVLGFLAKSKENLRKHLMHAAVLIGLIGFLATVSAFPKLPTLFDGTAERPAAVVSQFLTSVICLIFVILSIKSFIDARRGREI
jgi:fluoride ion exporter CrcB/FEX